MTGAALPPRIEARIVRTAGGCWLWTGSCQTKGYGQVYWQKRNRTVHRLAYELLVGPIAAGMTIDHLCLNKRCCNPEHLEVVTRAENLSRAHASGLLRSPWAGGSTC